MPVSTEKAAVLNIRRQTVKTLIGLGLSKVEIAQMMGIEVHFIYHDCNTLGITQSESAPATDEQTDAILHLYNETEDMELRQILGNHRFVSEMRILAQGALMMLREVSTINAPLPLWCRKLLTAISEERFGLPEVEAIDFDSVLKEMLSSTVKLPNPTHRREDWWKRRLMSVIRQKFSTVDTMVVDFDPASTLEAVLEEVLKLDSQEQEVIVMRFGINHRPMTLAQVGSTLGLTAERVRQIEKKAIETLEQAVRRGEIPLPTTVRDLKTQLESSRQYQEKLQAQLTQSQRDEANLLFDTLNRRIDMFKLSTRANNVLTNPHCLNLWCVGQVAQMSDDQLLKMQNFGRTSLEEVRRVILEPFGLTTGMTFQNWSPPPKNPN